MKAAVFRQVGEPMAIEDVDISLPRTREVLLRTAAVGICHSDLHFIDGHYQSPVPTILGHEAAAIVEKTGSEVTRVKPGDRVISCLSVFCGHCPACASGRPFGCDSPETRRAEKDAPRLEQRQAEVHQFYNLSAFAEQMLVHENAIVKIDRDMPMDKAALIGCSVVTGFGAVINTARVAVGSSVAVIGCGGVGLSAINGAAIAGAGRVIAIDILSDKLDLASRVGATDMIDASKDDPVERVRELTGGGVDYSFEALGRKETVEQAFSMLAPSGTATVIGMISRTQKIEIVAHELLADRKLIGSNMGSNRFIVDMPRYIDFYLDGRLKLDHLVSNHIGLDQVNLGVDELRAGGSARSVIVFDK